MPFLFILFIKASSSIIKELSKTSVYESYFYRNPIFPKKHITEVLIAIFTISGIFLANSSFITEIFFLEKPPHNIANEENVNAAIAINELTSQNASVGVFWAGSIPYYSGREAVDFLGKSDRYIANLLPDPSISWHGMDGVPGHDKYDLNYSIKVLKPTYVQGFKWGTQDLTSYANDHYEKINYKGTRLFLAKNSPLVFWEKLDIP